jgi:hypothetical protein
MKTVSPSFPSNTNCFDWEHPNQSQLPIHPYQGPQTESLVIDPKILLPTSAEMWYGTDRHSQPWMDELRDMEAENCSTQHPGIGHVINGSTAYSST